MNPTDLLLLDEETQMMIEEFEQIMAESETPYFLVA